MTEAPVGVEEADPPSPRYDRLFRIVVALKGLDGALELVAGIFLLLVAPSEINHVVRSLTAHELAQDPTDFVARHLVTAAGHLSRSSTVYGGIYLAIHGVAKAALVVLVLRNKLWAYPAMVLLLAGFIAYQLVQIASKPGAGLIALTVFDAVVAWMTWREWRAKRRARQRT
jgi:uncharacterized membrane protein